jgi:hypothetical protein
LDASVSSQNQSQERNPTLSQVVHNGVAKGWRKTVKNCTERDV